MKEEYKKKTSIQKISEEVRLRDIQTVLYKTEAQTPEALKTKKLAFEREKIQLLGGRSTSVFDEKKKLADLISEVPVQREAKFAEFFEELGNLAGWSEETKKAWRKPKLAPITINETIYLRFPPEVVEHIHKHNPYFRWCLRKYKNYAFLGEEGILHLEKYIYEAVIEMQSASDIYEFRSKLGAKYGVPYQTRMF